MRIRVGLIFSFIVAASIHLFVFNAFVFTFPNIGISTKPVFVFLGSFLRPQDVVLSAVENLGRQGDNISGHYLNLDIREGSLPRDFDKPNLTNKVARPVKFQYKPVMRDENRTSKPKESLDDLGVDLAPFSPVRMRMDQNDQN